MFNTTSNVAVGNLLRTDTDTKWINSKHLPGELVPIYARVSYIAYVIYPLLNLGRKYALFCNCVRHRVKLTGCSHPYMSLFFSLDDFEQIQPNLCIYITVRAILMNTSVVSITTTE